MKGTPVTALAAGALVLMLAACGSSGPASSAPPGPAPSQDNAVVCRHYLSQRAWVKGLAAPTLADALRFETDIAVDAAQTTPGTKLARDLSAMSADETAGRSSYAASLRVYGDCT